MIMQPRRTVPRTPSSDAVAQWLANAKAWNPESAPTWVTKLRADGVELPPPAEVPESEASSRLASLIDALAARGVFLAHTDHLDDQSLYAYLVSTALAAPAPPRGPGTCELIDLCPPYGSGIDTMLACHASDELRAELAARGVPLPPRTARAADRDQHLPRPPEPPQSHPD